MATAAPEDVVVKAAMAQPLLMSRVVLLVYADVDVVATEDVQEPAAAAVPVVIVVPAE